MKVLNFLFALLFLVFAFVQVNDPDPLLWILIYGNMAVLSVLAMFNMQFKYWQLITAVIYIAYAAVLAGGAWQWWQSPDRSLLFDEIAKMQNIYIEETREFLGLLICLVILLVQYLTRARVTR